MARDVLNVLYVSQAPFFSGAERALVAAVTALQRLGVRPSFVLGHDGHLATVARRAGWPVRVLPLIGADLSRPIASVRSLLTGLYSCLRVRPDLIHVNDVPSYQPLGLAGRVAGVPVILHVRFPETAAGLAWFLRPRGFAHALFVSEALRKQVLDEAPLVLGANHSTWHDGVELMPKEAIAAGERMRLRAELGIPADGVLVGMTGQLARIKGVWDFLDAAEILVRRGAPARFAYLGDDLKGNGEVRRDLERSVHSRHLADRITFLGYREDAHRLVPAFDVIAVPSHVEPLGNATLEAMASGRPVVGSRVGGIPEMLVDGWTGLLVPPNDPRDLADALAGLIAERELRETMGSRGRIRAERHFSVDVQAQVLREHYERAVARPSAH